MNSTPTPQEGPERGPNCWECRYLMITWDTRMPYGCACMGFRSRVLPSIEVLRTDGRFCGGFQPKVKPGGPRDVETSTPRRETDHLKPFRGINLIT